MTPGSLNSHSKLTEEDVLLILKLLDEREKYYQAARALSAKRIGEKFGVSKYTIDKIAVAKSWTHV